MFLHKEFIFRKIFFLHFGGPTEQFDIHTKLSLEFMVGLTTPSPGAKGLVKLNHLWYN